MNVPSLALQLPQTSDPRPCWAASWGCSPTPPSASCPVLSSLSMPKRKLVMAATSVDGTEGVAFVVTGWTVATWGVFGG